MQCEACKNTSVDLLKDDKLLPFLSKTDSRRITVLFALLTDVLKTAKLQIDWQKKQGSVNYLSVDFFRNFEYLANSMQQFAKVQ